MKKVLTVVSIILCCFLLFACTEKPAENVATPADPPATTPEGTPAGTPAGTQTQTDSEPSHETIDVYVTFSNAGELALKQEKVTVADTDDDEKFTAQETFDAFHAAKSKEFVVSEGYITKIWSIKTGDCMYYVNDVLAEGLNEEVKDGDYFNVFIFADTTAWSDSYSFFTARQLTAVKGQEFNLVLKNIGFDAEWNTVIAATEGATITVNGEAKDIVTDANGIATLSFAEAGTYVISATSTTTNLVPPVCVVTVK